MCPLWLLEALQGKRVQSRLCSVKAFDLLGKNRPISVRTASRFLSPTVTRLQATRQHRANRETACTENFFGFPPAGHDLPTKRRHFGGLSRLNFHAGPAAALSLATVMRDNSMQATTTTSSRSNPFTPLPQRAGVLGSIGPIVTSTKSVRPKHWPCTRNGAA